MEHAAFVSIAVTDLDDDELVTLQDEVVVRHGHCGDRGRRDLPGPEPVPENLSNGHVKAHLLNRARRHDLCAEPLGQHTGVNQRSPWPWVTRIWVSFLP
jgi:hypothetical protein